MNTWEIFLRISEGIFGEITEGISNLQFSIVKGIFDESVEDFLLKIIDRFLDESVEEFLKKNLKNS